MIYIPFVAFWITNIIGIPQRVRRVLKKDRLRPFDCPKCMGFWLAVVHFLFAGFTSEAVYIIPMCSLSAWLLEVICLKLKIPINQ